MRLALFCALAATTAALHVPGGAPCDTMRRTAPSPPSAMHLRGGLMDSIDPEIVAKIGLGAISVEGAMFTLAPKKSLEMYKIPKPSSMMGWFNEQTGFMHVAFGILGYLTLAGKPLNESVAWALIPFFIQCIKAVLNDTPKQFG